MKHLQLGSSSPRHSLPSPDWCFSEILLRFRSHSWFDIHFSAKEWMPVAHARASVRCFTMSSIVEMNQEIVRGVGSNVSWLGFSDYLL